MNRKIVFNVTGKLLWAISALMLLPLVVSVIYRENKTLFAFLAAIVIGAVAGGVLQALTRKHSKVIYAKEGFLIASLAWVASSLLGCIPFILSGTLPNFFDAFFEMVSGFTTTGSSVIPNVEACSHGILFWRSFSHWVGGMGVLVFLLIFVGSISDQSIHILRAEMPGPVVGKLTPRAKDTSRVLYLIYIVMTVVQILLLWAGDMDLFESAVHAFGTAGTGGFGIKADGLASYSPYSQWVITVFMLLFGINFNLYFLVLMKRLKVAVKSEELWAYFGFMIVCSGLITVNIYGLSGSETLSDSIRAAAFQVSSVMTTTGYATVDYAALWPSFSQCILLLLMFTGACAGSTAGGFKMSRVVMLSKMIAKEFRRLVHPRSVQTVKFEGKEIDENVQKSVSTYLAIYVFCLIGFNLIISLEPFGFETNFSAVMTCFNNVGPGLGMVGPMGNFSIYNDFSTFVLSLAMLLGRLEIFPLLIAMIPSTWKRK